jgi:hypothetical protein
MNSLPDVINYPMWLLLVKPFVLWFVVNRGFTTWLGFSEFGDLIGLNQGPSQGRNLLQPQPDKITTNNHGTNT